MIRIYQSTEKGLSPSNGSATSNCWIDVTNPTSDEVKRLIQEWNIPEAFIKSSLDRHEISHTEKTDQLILILVRIARFQGTTTPIPYDVVPMGIIRAPEWVMTICLSEHGLLHHLTHEHEIDVSTSKPTRFVLHLLWSVANNYILHLGDINDLVDKLEDRLQQSLQNREVRELLRYQKSLVHFTTALRANETMLERLHRSKSLEMEPKDEDLLDDVFTEYQQAIGMSQIASDILSQMMDAFASIISNNLNVVMKFLAAITVILTIPATVGTFYGMNIRLPLEEHPSAFLILIGISLLFSIVVGLIFRRNDWL